MEEKVLFTASGAAAVADPPSPARDLHTINEVAAALNVHQQTLRNWERKKLIVPMRVGARRIYTAKHIELCKKIREFSGKGVPLKGIRELLKKI